MTGLRVFQPDAVPPVTISSQPVGPISSQLSERASHIIIAFAETVIQRMVSLISGDGGKGVAFGLLSDLEDGMRPFGVTLPRRLPEAAGAGRKWPRRKGRPLEAGPLGQP